MGKFEDFGLQKPDHAFFETHPIVNQQLVYYVGHGDITPKPDIERFDAAGAVFTDGTRRMSTSWSSRPGTWRSSVPRRPGRPRRCAGPAPTRAADGITEVPEPVAVGLIQPDSGQWTIAHWQAMAIAAFLDLQRRDPAAAQRLHDELNAERTRRFSGGSH